MNIQEINKKATDLSEDVSFADARGIALALLGGDLSVTEAFRKGDAEAFLHAVSEAVRYDSLKRWSRAIEDSPEDPGKRFGELYNAEMQAIDLARCDQS
jgi:hypothetical protein